MIPGVSKFIRSLQHYHNATLLIQQGAIGNPEKLSDVIEERIKLVHDYCGGMTKVNSRKMILPKRRSNNSVLEIN